jgi:protein SCO1/2
MITRVASLLITVALAAAPACAQQAPTPEPLDRIGFDQNLGDPIDTTLTFADSEGNPFPLAQALRDRPVILTLVYFDCPMLCAMTLDGVVRALQQLPFDAATDYRWVVVSFDPSETPADARTTKRTLAARYAHAGADTGWHFLTGDETSIRALADAVGFRYAYDERTKQFAHPAGATILTPQGRISAYLFGTDFNPADLRLALVDASGGAIGSPTDQILLRCYHYDPATGRYNLAILSGVRIAGALTTLAIIGLIVALLRRERLRRRARAEAATA